MRAAADLKSKEDCKEHGLETDYWLTQFLTFCFGFHNMDSDSTGAWTIQHWSANTVSSLDCTGAITLKHWSTGMKHVWSDLMTFMNPELMWEAAGTI